MCIQHIETNDCPHRLATTLEPCAHQIAIWGLGAVTTSNLQVMALQHLCEGKSEILEIRLEGECLDCCIRNFDRALRNMKQTHDLEEEEDDEKA